MQILCSIQGCGKPKDARGFCSAHYTNLRRRGDPLIFPKRASHGDRLKWLIQNVCFEGSECLYWHGNKSPYPNVELDGKTQKAHRLMCRLAHGEPPELKMHAAHNCGNGHLGCLNPHHLRWDSAKGNAADRLIHGRHNRGERQGRVKLTEAQARKIKFGPKESSDALSKQYSVSRAAICHIRRGSTWGWLCE